MCFLERELAHLRESALAPSPDSVPLVAEGNGAVTSSTRACWQTLKKTLAICDTVTATVGRVLFALLMQL